MRIVILIFFLPFFLLFVGIYYNTRHITVTRASADVCRGLPSKPIPRVLL